MRQRVVIAALAVFTAAAGFPLTDDWRARMDEGSAAEAAGDYAGAASLYRAATEIAERFDHRDRRRAVAWNSLATMYDAMGRFADAEAGYRRALKMAAESTGKSGADYGQALPQLRSYVGDRATSGRNQDAAGGGGISCGRSDEVRIAAAERDWRSFARPASTRKPAHCWPVPWRFWKGNLTRGWMLRSPRTIWGWCAFLKDAATSPGNCCGKGWR